jgi:aspartokinase/homoserine dehydrogenase 1
VLSADPRIIPQAFVVDEITIEEAMEMSYFGAQVIHPYTVIPAVQNDIPIVIKNTMNPAAPGTRIVKNAKPHGHAITGIASIGKAALLNVEGNGFIQSKDLTSRLFSLLAEHSIPIIMISQASSEHSLCLALLEDHAEKACILFNEKFKEELACNEIQNIVLQKNIEVIAVIGENMKGRPGIAGKLFACLGNAQINVLAIAQGSSERNISFIIDRKDTLNALKEIHKTFLGV